MKTFAYNGLPNSTEFIQMEKWLFENIGPGGSWLKDNYPNPNGSPVPEENDLWGYWINSGRLCFGILEESKAALFFLRWGYD